MKIAHIVPGSGGTFYCQNCARDMSLVRALRAQGHDAMVMPMYLPLFDEPDSGMAADTPVFYGAVNVYLEQKLPFYKYVPRPLKRILDAKAILKLAARQSGSTQPAGLENMTLSVLRGQDGRQARDMTELLAWLSRHERPDVVHLSNALLLGLAPGIKNEIGVPVVCSLQDEHTWIDSMAAPYDDECWNLLHHLASHVDIFVPVSQFYNRMMQNKLRLPDSKFRVVPLGVDLSAYIVDNALPTPPAIGFLSPISKNTGFDILFDAFLLLRKNPDLTNLRLYVTGGFTGDEKFMAEIRKRIEREGVAEDVCFVENFGPDDRGQFMRNLSVFSVPGRIEEAFGLYQLEAMAGGVPVVQPRLGAFPEIVGATGGGIIYEPNTPAALAAALKQVLENHDLRMELGRKGRAAVEKNYTIQHMADNMSAMYRTC